MEYSFYKRERAYLVKAQKGGTQHIPKNCNDTQRARVVYSWRGYILKIEQERQMGQMKA